MSKQSDIPGVVVQFLLNDMNSTSKLQQQLAESIGFDNGYEKGYIAGAAAAQRRMRRAMFEVQLAAGVYDENVLE